MRIFLSYSRADAKNAELISVSLKQAGHKVFFDRASIKAAEDFNRVIWGEIQKSDLFVFLISPNSVRTGSYALTELALAEKRWPNPERRVLAVVIESTEFSGIPVYASICHILRPRGNVAAEVRAEVNALYKGHRLRSFGRITAIIAGLVIIGSLVMWGYREYLEQRPLVAREKLVAMDVYNKEDFIKSASESNVKMIELYLTAGMDPNVSREDDRYEGVTALMMAIKGDHFEVVEMLLDAGADVNAMSLAAGTALAWAAGRGQDATVRALLEAGADNEAVNAAFVSATISKNVPIMRLLLSHGVRQATIDEAFVKGAEKGAVEPLRILLDKISHRSKVASDALVRAASQFRKNTRRPTEAERIETFRYLLDSGADVNAKDDSGVTPLFSVAYHQDFKLAKLLLDNDANVNAKDDSGFTPLIWVTYHQDFKLAKLLLDNDANVDVRCECSNIYDGGWTPLALAIYRSRRTPGMDSIVDLLLASGADVNLAQDYRNGKYRRTPLMLAAQTGDLQLVRTLLEKGAKVNDQNHNGYTVLYYAASNKEMVAELLTNGADAQVGTNPLLPVVGRNKYRSVENLLAAGADVNKKDNEGQTPLMAAAREASADMVRLLLAEGARAADKDNMGRTAETFAKRRQHDEIIELLQNAVK